MPMLLYLHGFNSSPESKKALQTQRWYADNAADINFVCPALPPFADRAMGMLRSLVEALIEGQLEGQPPEPVYLIGSSMGGFFCYLFSRTVRTACGAH